MLENSNYKENEQLNSRINIFFYNDQEYDSVEKNFKKKEDINNLACYLENFNLDNMFSENFIETIRIIKHITGCFYFEEYHCFIEYDIFNTLFSLAFPNPGDEYDYLQSRALKILRNLVECPIKWYVDHITETEIIANISNILVSKSDTVINNAIKLLISIAPVDISITQDILTFIKVDKLIQIYNKFHEYDSVKKSIIRLIYLLARCDTSSEINDFFEFLRILIYEIQPKVTHRKIDDEVLGIIITIFTISHFLMKDVSAVQMFCEFPLFIEFLNFSLDLNTKDNGKNFNIWYPALKTIDFMHKYYDDLIKELNYELFSSFLSSPDEESEELATEAFINILSTQELTVFSIEELDIINKLVNCCSIELTYIVKKNAIEAISNAILNSPTYLLSSFVELGCVNELLQSLCFEDSKVLCKIIKSLDILLYQHVFDDQENDIVETEFENCFDPDLFTEILENQDEKVRLNLEKLISNHPEFFCE